MTYAPGRHIYLAAPFFNDTQRELCEFIEGLTTSELPIYSPRIDGGVLTPDAEPDKIKETFTSNCVAIDTAEWVLAVIDDFDPGVMWEMGYAFPKTPTLGYSDIPGRGLNVMLAGSCRLGFVNGRAELRKLFESSNGLIEFPNNTWSGQIQ